MKADEVKAFDRPDRKRRVSIICRADGFYSFIENGEHYEDCTQESYWAPYHVSGIYTTAEEAERNARITIPWLRDFSNRDTAGA